jgi:hypothetical protein
MGRARARGHYFEESWEIIGKCKEMTRQYQLENDADIEVLMVELDSILRNSQCEQLQNDYEKLLAASASEKEDENYIGALDYANKAIEMVLDDTVCGIDDHEGWYMRAVLEYPVEYMKRRKKALSLIPGDTEGFITAYHDLEQFYLDMRLNGEGVSFIPMIKQVEQFNDIDLHKEMLSYYSRQKLKDDAISMMDLLWDLYGYAPDKSQQKRMAEWFAREDILSGCNDPISCLNSSIPADPSFKPFKYHYKMTWVKDSGSRFRHLSLFLKNKPADN